MFRIIDRYTLREILPPFVLALLVFTFMLMMGPIEKVARDLLAKNVPAGTIIRMLVLLLPSSLAITIPIAFLLGLLVAFGRLSGDSEWVALQACGVTLLRMLRPVMALAVVCWGATSWVMLDAVPSANQAYREIAYGVIAARVETEIRPRIFFTDFPNLVLYTKDTAPGAGWSDVFVADTRQPGPPLVSVARGGRMVLDEAQRRVEMVLDDRTTYSMSTGANGQAQFEQSMSKELSSQLDPEQVFPKAMPVKGEPEKTIAELRQTIEELRKTGQPTDRAEYYIQLKFSIPFACLVFALMGLGFGVSSSRGGKLAAFAMGSAVIFAYYVIMYQARSLSLSGVWPAWLAAWLPNIVLGPAGAWVVYRRARSAGRSFQLTLPAVGFLRRFLPQGARPAAATGTAGASPSASSRPVLVIRFPQVWLPRLGILDRYISRNYLRLQALTFVSLLGIFYIATFIDLSDKLFGGVTTANLVLQLFIFKTPQFIYYIVPLSVLIATLVTVGGLTRNSELIVMRACGISLYRAAYPLIVLAAGASLLLFGLEEYVLAPSDWHARNVEHIVRSNRPLPSAVLNRRWIAARDGSIYHYDLFDVKSGSLVGFWHYEFATGSWRLSRITYMEHVRFARPSATPGSPVGAWRTGAGWVREIKSDSESTYATFTSKSVTMELPEYFGAVQPDATSMTYAELSEYIDEMRGAGHNILEYLVDLHRKISFPFVTVVMALLAVPFAVTTGRRGALYGIGVGIVLAIVYWTANNLFAVVGSAGMVSPALAAWAPNLLFGAGALYMILTVRT
jgi:LPS export ABC transporter permease LptG/LPS export ABC transporter permease LptF